MSYQYLWRIAEEFPARLFGKYNKSKSPSRFVYWKGSDIPRALKMPEFCFETDGGSLEQWDALGNDAGLPLVGPRLASLLTEFAGSDIQLIKASVIVSRGRIDGWSILTPLFKVNAIDRNASEFWLINDTQSIGGFRRLRLIENCLGEHQIARDADYHPHILVGLEMKLLCENAGIRGVEFVSDEQFLQ